MRSDLRRSIVLAALAVLALMFWDRTACAQTNYGNGTAPPVPTNNEDVKALRDLVHQLQSQVEALNARVKLLEASEKSGDGASHGLPAERKKTAPDSAAVAEATEGSIATASSSPMSAGIVSAAAGNNSPRQDTDERIARLQEDLELANSKIREQSQTKMESGPKYRVRVSGLALFNLFANRGTVDNQDAPQIATPARASDSSGTFGGSLRQSQIGLEGFGPEIAGARTSAEIRFDFAGGFARASNGEKMGLVRLRTGTVRFDWADTSVVAGQDYLFFSPLAPTSFASVAIPALSYTGNLWGWTPQVRVEQRFHISEESTILVQGGILETLSGDYSGFSNYSTATRGQESGQPAYATRVAWSHPAFGQSIVAGLGGYYGRQGWGFGRYVDGWAGTADLTVPLGKFVEFAGQFYRGRAVGGLGGGIGQNVLWNGQLGYYGTEVYGLNSMGGWVQLKLKPIVKFEVNGAVGDDSPFSSELRRFSGNPLYSGGLLSRNLGSFVNFIYRPRSDVLFSLEYKHLKTFTLDSNPKTANHINLSIGYIF